VTRHLATTGRHIIHADWAFFQNSQPTFLSGKATKYNRVLFGIKSGIKALAW
jgi:hypothetical protein